MVVNQLPVFPSINVGYFPVLLQHGTAKDVLLEKITLHDNTVQYIKGGPPAGGTLTATEIPTY